MQLLRRAVYSCGVLISRSDQEIPENLTFPLMIKPTSEGSNKGITKDSVAENPEAARKRVNTLLRMYPAGVVVEEFIRGQELSAPFLEAYP